MKYRFFYFIWQIGCKMQFVGQKLATYGYTRWAQIARKVFESGDNSCH